MNLCENMTNRDRKDYATTKEEKNFYSNVLTYQILIQDEPERKEHWQKHLLRYCSEHPEYEVSEYSGFGKPFPQDPLCPVEDDE